MAKKEIAKDQKRLLAEELYINTDMSQKEICAIVGWTEKTFSENKKKHSWEELKAANTITPNKLIAEMYSHISDLLSEQKKAREEKDTKKVKSIGDEISKLSSAIEKMSNKKTTIPQYMNVFKEYTTFLIKKDAELAKKNNEYQSLFIQEKINGSN
jgi:hypothetical protein